MVALREKEFGEGGGGGEGGDKGDEGDKGEVILEWGVMILVWQ
ncbi:MAG: hypothetical protein ACHBN1_03275 [Heteroscytonema crispum UTEX LB 1556]